MENEIAYKSPKRLIKWFKKDKTRYFAFDKCFFLLKLIGCIERGCYSKPRLKLS